MDVRSRTAGSDKKPEPPRKRGPKVDVELTKRRKADILREAARLFEQVGYHGVNMEMIAEATGLKKPTLYHYIRSKDQILFEIQEIIIGTLLREMKARRQEKMDPEAILRGMFHDTFQLMYDYPGFVRVFFEFSRELQGDRKDEVRESRSAYLQALMDVVREGMDQGLFAPADVRVTAFCLLGTCNWSYHWYRPSKDLPPEELADQCWAFALSGLKGGSNQKGENGA